MPQNGLALPSLVVILITIFAVIGGISISNYAYADDGSNSGGKQATHDNANTENNCQENTDNQNTDSAPSGSVLVLNIKHHVTNDEDSGFHGYWALDNYEKHIKIWQTSPGNFYVVTNYEGTWQTFAGALSPGAGVAESKDASGCFEGGYVATFSGTFAPGDHSTHGDIGTFDYGGTKADILRGAGQVGNPPHFSYLDTYFSSTSNFNYINWGWDYHFDSQLWHNFSTGSYGDIIV